LNLIEMHSYLRDDCGAYAQQLAGLGQLLFFSTLFNEDFTRAMTLTAQYRYVMSFGLVCRSYPNFSNTFIAASKELMTKQAIYQLDKICIHIANKALFMLQQIVERESSLSRQLAPYPAVEIMVAEARAKLPQKGKSPTKQPVPAALPGEESTTYSSELVDSLRGFQQALTHLCWAMNHEETVKVTNYTFSPKEYFAEDVIKFLTGEIQRRIRTDPGKQLPRPTMLWYDIKSLMGSVRHVESYVNINMAEVLENVLIDQTIADDVSQNATVSAAYIQFYLNLVFGITPQGGICVSTSKKAFVSLAPGPIKAEEYTDVQELQALCIMLGAFGVKQLDSMLLKTIFQYVEKMKQIVGANRADLEILKTKTVKTQQCADSLMRLKGTKEFTQLGIQIGTALEFRKLLTEALGKVTKSRIPFIHEFVHDLHEFHSNTGQFDELALSTGLRSAVDPAVVREMGRHCRSSDADFSLWSHMMVMCAAGLSLLASDETTVFSPELDAHTNNAHTLSIMISELSSAAFSITAGQGTTKTGSVTDAQTEFLRIAAIFMLRLGVNTGDAQGTGCCLCHPRQVCERDGVPHGGHAGKVLSL